MISVETEQTHDLLEYAIRRPDRATVHLVTKNQVGIQYVFDHFRDNDYPNSEQKLLERLNQMIPEIEDLRRGDMIQVEWENYRNTGSYIYDGIKITDLDGEPDDYGTLPKQFGYPEFPLKYWSGIICHNNMVWIDTNAIGIDLLLNNLSICDDVEGIKAMRSYNDNTEIKMIATFFNEAVSNRKIWIVFDVDIVNFNFNPEVELEKFKTHIRLGKMLITGDEEFSSTAVTVSSIPDHIYLFHAYAADFAGVHS